MGEFMKRMTIENNLDFLRQISTDVDFENDDYNDYINKLKEYCRDNVVYAMAPVQIGIPKRLIYMKNTKPDMKNNENASYDEERIYINPIITKIVGKTRFLEGCESCMDLVGVVERPYMLEIEYYDKNGNKKSEILEGFEATVFSHEFDHLNGVLHIDIAEEVMEMTYEEKKKYRSDHPYEIISEE